MKAHKGGYVNKTNEKPVLRGEGEKRKKEALRDLLFVKGCSIYFRHWRSEWCHHRGISQHLLMAEKQHTQRLPHSSVNWKRWGKEDVGGSHTCGEVMTLSHAIHKVYTERHTFAVMLQLLHVLSGRFSAWGQRGERLRLGHALFIVCSSGNIMW